MQIAPLPRCASASQKIAIDLMIMDLPIPRSLISFFVLVVFVLPPGRRSTRPGDGPTIALNQLKRLHPPAG